MSAQRRNPGDDWIDLSHQQTSCSCYCLVLFSRLALKWSLLYQACEISNGEWNCPSDMVCIVNLHEETLSIIELGRGRYEGFLSRVIALQSSTSLQLIHAQPKLWRQGRRTEPLSHLCQEGDGWGCQSCCYVWFAWRHPLHLPKSGEHHSCTTVFKRFKSPQFQWFWTCEISILFHPFPLIYII